MKNKKKTLKLPLRFELAYEIIYQSICFISISLAFLFASNLLRFNWYSVFFGTIALILIYLKQASYLLIEEGQLQLIYLKFFKKYSLELKRIDECIFYENISLVKIKTINQKILTLHLKEKHKEKLLNWMVVYYPKITALYIKST